MTTALRYYYITKLGERVVADLRKATYAHILTLDPSLLPADPHRRGAVTPDHRHRHRRDPAELVDLHRAAQPPDPDGRRSRCWSFVSAKLTGLVLLLFPFVLAPLFLFGRKVRKLTVSTQDRFAEAVGLAGESVDALETVQAFGREGAAVDRFGAAVEEAFGDLAAPA